MLYGLRTTAKNHPSYELLPNENNMHPHLGDLRRSYATRSCLTLSLLSPFGLLPFFTRTHTHTIRQGLGSGRAHSDSAIQLILGYIYTELLH
jgi:hypothetical protein